MWEKNNFVRSQTVLSAFLLSALFISVVTLLGILLLGMPLPGRLVYFTIGQVILAIIAIWLMRKFEVFDANDFKFNQMGRGLLISWFGFVYVGISFLINYMQIPNSAYITRIFQR